MTEIENKYFPCELNSKFNIHFCKISLLYRVHQNIRVKVIMCVCKCGVLTNKYNILEKIFKLNSFLRARISFSRTNQIEEEFHCFHHNSIDTYIRTTSLNVIPTWKPNNFSNNDPLFLGCHELSLLYSKMYSIRFAKEYMLHEFYCS